MDQKQAELGYELKAKRRRFFYWLGTLRWFLGYLIGVALWRLFQIYANGRPFEFLYERIGETITMASGSALGGYSSYIFLRNKYGRDHAAAAIKDLIGTIENVDPPLHPGTANSLLAKLNNAQAELAAGNTAEARALIGACINDVRAQAGKALTQAQADELIAAANTSLAALG